MAYLSMAYLSMAYLSMAYLSMVVSISFSLFPCMQKHHIIPTQDDYIFLCFTCRGYYRPLDLVYVIGDGYTCWFCVDKQRNEKKVKQSDDSA